MHAGHALQNAEVDEDLQGDGQTENDQADQKELRSLAVDRPLADLEPDDLRDHRRKICHPQVLGNE